MGLWRSIRKNAALLTVSSLVMQSLSMLWQVWLAAHIGPAGIGLFQLIGSVGFLFITLAVSGIRFSVTRLLAEELGAVPRRERLRRDAPLLRLRALFRAGRGGHSLFSCRAHWFSGSGTPARYARCTPRRPPFRRLRSRALCPGTSPPSGACGKRRSPSFSHSFCAWDFSALLLAPCSRGDLSAVCAALSASGTAAEIALARACRALSRRPETVLSGGRMRSRSHAADAAHRAAARLVRLCAERAQHVPPALVPRGLRLSGLSAESALAGYGVINGMAMPVLLLPTCLPLSVAELLVPALTEMQVAGEHGRVRRSVREMLGKTFLLSLGAAAAFFVFARPLGMLLYGSAEAARFLRLLAPMVPFLYTDIVTDGCLKGLGQMMASMAFNIAEAALGLVLVWALLPRWALTGYLVTLYICEVFNFTLSLCGCGRL